MSSTLRIFTVSLAIAVWASASPAQQADKPEPRHNWTSITYPSIPSRESQKNAPPSILLNNDGIALGFHMVFSAKDANELPSDEAIVVRLHRPNGQIIEPKPSEPRGKIGAGNFALGFMSYPYTYLFPWQENSLEEAWIECRLPGQTYWVEIPYGFTRNPADPLKSTDAPAGSPTLAPAMKNLGDNDQILPWVYVTYDLGEIQNRWRASVQVGNPFDTEAEIILYRDDSAVGRSAFLWDIHSPKTSIQITGLTAMTMGIRLHDDGMRRSDSFKFNRNPSGQQRNWGTATVKVEDRSYQFTVPSSLFKYVHGIVREYPKTPIPRIDPARGNR